MISPFDGRNPLNPDTKLPSQRVSTSPSLRAGSANLFYGRARLLRSLMLPGVFLGCILGSSAAHGTEARPPDRSERSGGRLVVDLRAEPQTFNPAVAADRVSQTIIRRLTADLVHIDRQTQETVPALAHLVTTGADGKSFEIELRKGLKFSDGVPLTAEDVLFSFEVYLDPAIGSPNRDLLLVEGEPIRITKLADLRLRFELAQPYAVGDRLFDSLAILPRHRLEKLYRAGRLPEAWGLSTDPTEIAGLGPFRLRRYLPGERVELERNPHYWKTGDNGEALPYLDELIFRFAANNDAQMVRFQAGETHVIHGLTAESFERLDRQPEPRSYVLHDVGPQLRSELLVLNLNSLAGRDLPDIEDKQRWFRLDAFRRALSVAADRRSMVRLIYRGRATAIAAPVSRANKLWRNDSLEPPQHSVAAARQILGDAGFSWSPEGLLLDDRGQPIQFSIATSSSNQQRQQMAAILQQDLRQIGIQVQIVTLEFRALVDRLVNTFEYEAAILGLGGGDVDPNGEMNVWMTTGSNHLWHLGQKHPATPWESEIDTLMRRQLTEIHRPKRKELYDRVQELVAEHLPFIFLVSPNLLVGAHRDLGNFTPVVLDHSTLWNVEELFWIRQNTAH